MAFAPYLSCQDLSIQFGEKPLFQGVKFAVQPGERWGIVGPNGAGKSTFFRLLSKEILPDKGTISLRNGLSYVVVTQRWQTDLSATVWEAVSKSLPSAADLDSQAAALEKELDAHSLLAATDTSLITDERWTQRFCEIQDALSAMKGAGTQNILESALRLCDLLDLAQRPLHTLSGGQLKRTQILCSLLQNPQLILLDEPTNHLDLQTVDWLEEFLLRFFEQGVGLLGRRDLMHEEPVSYVIISHDRALLDTLVNRILEIQGGSCTTYQGNFEAYMQAKYEQDIIAQQTRQKLQNIYKRELAWLRTGAKARTTKQTARIERAYSLDKVIQEKDAKAAFQQKKVTIEFDAQLQDEERNSNDHLVPVLRTLGEQQLVVLDDVWVQHPSKETDKEIFLFRKLNLVLKPRTRIALLGANGSGKSTLMNLIAGREKPHKGEVKTHELARISYFDQQRDRLPKDITVKRAIAPEGDYVGFSGQSLHISSYLERFLFTRPQLESLVADLSGGEQARLLLAKIMLENSNVLLLDEPTNDLDLPTLQTLEKNLSQFNGSLLFTSHDRYFVQRVATHILVCSAGKTHNQNHSGQWILCPDLDQALEVINKSSEEFKNSNEKLKTRPVSSSKSHLPKKQRRTQAEEKEWMQIDSQIAAQEQKIAGMQSVLEELYSKKEKHSETLILQKEFQKEQDKLTELNNRWEELFLKGEG